VIKKIAVTAASAMLVATMVFAASARPAYATTKVDCDAVMGELNGGKKPKLQRVVRKLTPALEAQCNGKSTLGRGGMISKLRAAKLASEGGVHVAIVNGRHPQGITLGMKGKIGTYFPPQGRK